MPTVEKLPDGGVVVTFDSEDTYAMKVETYQKEEWNPEGFLAFIRHKRTKGVSDYMLAKRIGMRRAEMLKFEDDYELEHRGHLLNLIIRRPLMESYLWHIANGEENADKQ